MTPEQRLDRLERIAKLFVRAGIRLRTTTQGQTDKINILIATQMRTEQRFAARFQENEERFAKNEERFAKNEERFAKTDQAINRLIAAQERTDHKIQALIDVISGKKQGDSLA